jgi:hypothetical protein
MVNESQAGGEDIQGEIKIILGKKRINLDMCYRYFFNFSIQASRTWKQVSRPREINVDEERNLAEFSNIQKYAASKKDSAKKQSAKKSSPKRSSPKKESPKKQEQPLFYGNIRVLGKGRKKSDKEAQDRRQEEKVRTVTFTNILIKEKNFFFKYFFFLSRKIKAESKPKKRALGLLKRNRRWNPI